MSFDPPLVEIPNITLYFLHAEGQIQATISISICFSRSPDFNPCNHIEVPQLSDPSIGVVVHSVMLPTNTTSVTYLRIDMELLPPRDRHPQDYIFLSEIRVAERLQGTYACSWLFHSTNNYTYSITYDDIITYPCHFNTSYCR